jgi:hypothetical protein
MEYSKLVSVTGMPGLYELISSKTDGAVVRSLEDKSSHFISSRSHNFSQLEGIEVFTKGDNVNLGEVFKAMEKSTEKLPDEKDPNAVKKYFEKVYKKYFEKVYPDMDFDRVYNSDQKKMIRWFVSLKKHDIEIKLPSPPEEPEAEEVQADATEEKPTTKKAKKK